MTADPWELLREAREELISFWEDATCAVHLKTNCKPCAYDGVLARIDAALAEQQDSAKDVVEPVDPWWQDKVFRSVFGSVHLTVVTNGPREWHWTVSFSDRRDRNGLIESHYGTAPTEAEAKEAAYKVARSK